MKHVLFFLTSIYLLIPVVKAEENSWYEIDGIKFRSGQADTEFKVYITSDHEQIIRSNISSQRRQLTPIVFTLSETVSSGPGGRQIFFRGGYLDFALKSEQNNLRTYPVPKTFGVTAGVGRQSPEMRTEIYNNFFSPSERTFADSNPNWALSADIESSHLFLGYYLGLFGNLTEYSRFFKMGVGIGILFLDLNLRLNLCSKYISDREFPDGNCEGKINIDYVSNDFITPSLIYTFTFFERVTDDSIWKFVSTEFSEMEGEAPKINLNLNNRKNKLYLTLNTSNIDFISYTYRF